MTTTVQAMTSTGKDNWLTPGPVLDSLDREFGFGLDAAASRGFEGFRGRPYIGPGSTWAQDALDLSVEWGGLSGGRPVFLNSPYSKGAGRGQGILAWHHRCWLECHCRGIEVVSLCPPHPGRAWFHRWARRADEVRVYKGRLAFIDPITGWEATQNTQDSCLVIYRPTVPRQGRTGGPRWSWIPVPQL